MYVSISYPSVYLSIEFFIATVPMSPGSSVNKSNDPLGQFKIFKALLLSPKKKKSKKEKETLLLCFLVSWFWSFINQRLL